MQSFFIVCSLIFKYTYNGVGMLFINFCIGGKMFFEKQSRKTDCVDGIFVDLFFWRIS